MTSLWMVWKYCGMKSRLMVLIGNIYVPPNNEEQLHTPDKVLECLKNETIILLGDFNARNTAWDNHFKQNTKLGAILEDIIQ